MKEKVERNSKMESTRLSELNEEDFGREILGRIGWLMNQKKLKQSDLAEISGIGQSTLSKVMKGEARLTMQILYRISKGLNITLERLFAEKFTMETDDAYKDTCTTQRALFNEEYLDRQILLRDTSHPAFRGYIGNKLFFYCFSTISTEASTMLEGEIEFRDSGGFCQAELTLYTGRVDANGKKIAKDYKGEMVISMPMSSCYIMMINKSIGEVCFINFRHFYLFNQDLLCRVGTLSSTSSGENKLPVMQRVLLSKVKLNVSGDDVSDQQFVRGQLRMNDSTIVIEDEEFMELREKESKCALHEFWCECENLMEKHSYLKLDEAKLKGLEGFSVEEKAKGIGILREKSLANKYNKISTKTDEYTFAYIMDRLEKNS